MVIIRCIKKLLFSRKLTKLDSAFRLIAFVQTQSRQVRGGKGEKGMMATTYDRLRKTKNNEARYSAPGADVGAALQRSVTYKHMA